MIILRLILLILGLIGRAPVAAATGREPANGLHMGTRVDQFESGFVYRRGLPHAEAVPRAGGMQMAHNRPEPVRPLRMVWARVVTEKRL